MRFSVELSAGPWAWAAAAALALAFVWHARRSKAGLPLLALRALGALALILALLRPSIVRKEAVLARPRLLVMLDHGHSMQGKAERGNRLEAAVAWLKDHRKKIEARADPVIVALSGLGRRVSWEELDSLKTSNSPFDPGVALRDAADALASGPCARAWLLSDGNADPASDWAAAASSLGCPIDSLGVGPSRRGKRLSFVKLKAPDFAFLHGRIAVHSTVEASAAAGAELRLRLLREDRSGRWETVSESVRRIGSDYETLTASLTAVAQSLGRERYRLEASAAGVSHSRPFHVEVIRQKYRIMYLSGRPSAEYAQLRDFLKADPNHELVSFVILRNPENPAFFADHELSLIPFPADEIFVQNLNQFDLFILENFSYSRFRLPPAHLVSLKSFVASGGALLVIGGENAFGLGGYKGSALEEMLPVALETSSPDFETGVFKAKPVAASHPMVKLYDTSEASLAAWAALPGMDGWARFSAVHPQATVLVVHPERRTSKGEPLPVVALREFGRGKVMLVSSDSTWRWKLGAASDWKIGGFYGRFWSRAVEYLTGNLDVSKVRFAPVPDRLPGREPAAFSLRVFDEGFRPAAKGTADVSVLWSSPDGKTREVQPQEVEAGIFSIELTGLTVGQHRLRASARLRGRAWGEDQVQFPWEGPPAESPMDAKWLSRLSEASGGEFMDIARRDPAALLEKLPPVREEAQVRQRYYPWASPFWLFLSAGLLALEWGLRRWRGHA